MKTIILYATKYGASHEIAQRIAKELPDTAIYDLKRGSIPPLSQFDCVILGGSLYANMLRKEVKNYALQNAAELSGKTLGLFLSGMSKDEDEKVNAAFDSNFPETLLLSAKAKVFPGGVFDPSKASWLDRKIFRMAAKQSAYTNTISNDKIAAFLKALKE